MQRAAPNAPDDVLSRFQHLASTLVEEILQMPRAFGTSLSSILPEGLDLIGDETFFDDEHEELRAENKIRIQNRRLRFKLDAFFVLLLCFPSRLTCLVFESLPTDRMTACRTNSPYNSQHSPSKSTVGN